MKIYVGSLTETFSKQRLAELSNVTKTSVFGQIYPLQKPDYSKDVTEASHKSFVLVHLTSSLGTNSESRLLSGLWRDLARKFGDLKFCEIKADMCIEGYPERNTPTILIYKDGDIKKQIVTLREFGGGKASMRGKLGNPQSRGRIAKFVKTSRFFWSTWVPSSRTTTAL